MRARALLLLPVLAGVAWPQRVEVERGESKTSGFSGVVHEASTGKPLERFTVTVWPRGFETKARRMAEQDFEGGAFEILGLAPGVYSLIVKAEGYVGESTGTMLVTAGETRRGLDFALYRSGTIRGIVVEKGSGRPIEGAHVQPSLQRDGSPHRSYVSGHGRSAPDGSFAIRNTIPGAWNLHVLSDGHLSWRGGPFELSEGGEVEVRVEMSPGGTIRGQVPAAALRDTAELIVDVRRAGGLDLGGSKLGPDGAFSIGGLTAGRYEVEVRDQDRSRDLPPEFVGEVDVEDGMVATVVLEPVVLPRVRLTGRVLHRGEPIAGAAVKVHPRAPELVSRRGWWGSLRAVTESDGSYHIEGVPPGEATLSLRMQASGGPIRSFSLTVPETSSFARDIRLPSWGIRGRVVRAADGSPVEGAVVTLAAAERQLGLSLRREDETQTSSDGTYQLVPIRPGPYEVLVTAPGTPEQPASLAGARRRPLELLDGELLSLDVPLVEGGSVEVHVVWPDGQIRGQLGVVLDRRDFADRPPFEWMARTTKLDGVARFHGVAPGRYAVTLMHMGPYAAPTTDAREVRAGQTTVWKIDLVEATYVRFQVRSAGDEVRAAILIKERPGLEVPTYGPEGAFLPGDYVARVCAPRFEERLVPFRVGEVSPQEVVIELEPADGDDR